MSVSLSAVTTRPVREARLGSARLTRAHLALNHRPMLLEAGGALAASVCQSLSTELGVPLACEARLLPSAVLPLDSLSQAAGFVLLELSSTAEAALLEIELPFLAALLGRLAGASGQWTPVSRLTRIEEATLGYLVLLALDDVRRHGGFWSSLGPRLLGLTLQRRDALARLDGSRRHLAVQLALDFDGVRGAARLLIPATALRSVLHAQPAAPPAQLSPHVAALELPVRYLLEAGSLSTAEALRLTRGDVVRIPGASRDDGGLLGPVRVRTPGFELRGALLKEGLRVLSAHPCAPSKEVVMNQSKVGFSEEQTERTPALPVELQVELTRMRMTVGQLAQLRVGHVLPLRIDTSEPVLLRLGDGVVARAELVDIEGELGARILSLVE